MIYWDSRLRGARRFFRELPFLMLGMPFALFQRVLRPWFKIRLCCVRSDRLGHFIGEADLQMSQKIMGDRRATGPREVTFHFLNSPPVNSVFAKTLRSHFIFGPRFALRGAYLINRVLPNGEAYLAEWPQIPGMADLSPLTRTSVWFKFDAEQTSSGWEILLQLGINPEDKYVCLFPRDASYGRSVTDAAMEISQRYRNCEVTSFLPSVEYLHAHGYKIVRMGRGVAETPNFPDNRVVDYATSNLASDLGDLFISSNCDFAISCDTGAVFLPTLFRRPIAVTNVMTPWGLLQGTSRNLHLMKSWRDPSGRYFTLRDLLFEDHQFLAMGPDASFFNALGLTCEDCTPDDLLDLTREMVGMMAERQPSDLFEDSSVRHAAKILSLVKKGNWNIRFPSQWLLKRSDFLSLDKH